MRQESEMLGQLLSFARGDERIRLVGMEGSRTNLNVPADEFRDYDISYLVTEIASFQQSDGWLQQFGPRLHMQKPEAMTMFPPELGNWYSYIILFEDGVKLDLTLIPVEELAGYLASDKLLKILLDKDGRVAKPPVPTDADYHVKQPSAAFFEDCCNEFWMVATYVVKGLCRRELLFAAEYLNGILRPQLMNMVSWKVGVDTGFSLSVGKCWKFIERWLSAEECELLRFTYRMESLEFGWEALFAAQTLFRSTGRFVAERLGFAYPPYDEKVSRYILGLSEKYRW